jgi:hypothetical protein
MTGLDLAFVLKEEMTRQTEIISVAMRRRAILQGAATRLRLGYAPAVVLAELDAAGESVALPAEVKP